MYELIYCRCGTVYGERPESFSTSNPHPHNFCPCCNRAVKAYECRIESVPSSVWVNTPKSHFQPNYID